MSASHDLFLSYPWADEHRVEPLLAALQSRGITVWRGARAAEDPSSIRRAVEAGLGRARALLAWYSVRYNDSRACQWELASAHVAAQAEADPRPRILVVNPEPGDAHVHLPERFDHLHLSAVGVPDDPSATLQLAERIQAALSRVPRTTLGELRALAPPPWFPAMGTGSSRFVGRLRQLWQLHGELATAQAARSTETGDSTGLALVVLVQGAGGMGKRLMAQEYALRFGAAYPGGVYWLRADGRADGGREPDPGQHARAREAQLIDIASRLGIDTTAMDAPQVRSALTRRFDQRDLPFLWVVDDLPADSGIEGLTGWLAPHPSGRTLITSRGGRMEHVRIIELPPLEAAAARALLTRHRPLAAGESAAADAICALLGCHALAVDLAAAWVDRRGLDGVLQALRDPDRDALALAATFDAALPGEIQREGHQREGHQREIAATLLASIEQVSAPARELLRYAAVLATAPIPIEMLRRCVAAGQGLDDAGAPDRVDLAVSQLLTGSLADEAGGDALRVHPLVCRTLRFTEPSADTWEAPRHTLIGILTKALPRASDIRAHEELAAWVLHARGLTAAPRDEPTAELLGWVARFDLVRGAYPLARDGFERQLEALRRILGEEHPDTLTAMNNLASSLSAQGDLQGARQLEEAVLRIMRRVLGEEHPHTLISMNNLALTLSDQGDMPGARQLQQEVVQIRRRVLGEEHPHTLTAMNNLAGMLWAHGDLPGARQLQEEELKISRRVLGEEHPATLTSMNSLAGTLWAQGDLPGARQLQEAELQISRRVLGEEHPDTLRSMSNLASTLSAQGDLPGARQLAEAVLRSRRRVLGEEHPDTLASMGNLASTLSAQADLPAARQLQEEALKISRRVLGEQHPDTLAVMNNLALTLGDQGDLQGARALEEAVLQIRRRVLGEEHPGTLNSMNNLASTLAAQGDLPGARQLQEAVLQIRRRVLGEEHPQTLTSLAKLGSTLRAQGDLAGARQLQEAVMRIMRRVLGEEHPDTLTSMNNLASTLSDQRDLAGARQLQEAVLRIMRRVLGEEHPHTLISMNNLALTLGARGDLQGARQLQEAERQISRRVLGEEHPDTLKSMHNLALTLRAQGDLPGARQLQEAVLQTRRRVLGEKHPDTLKSMHNLALTLKAQGDLPGARQLQEAVQQVRRRAPGDKHPETLTPKSNPGSTPRPRGDLPAAR
jgi:hypothetical protein